VGIRETCRSRRRDWRRANQELERSGEVEIAKGELTALWFVFHGNLTAGFDVCGGAGGFLSAISIAAEPKSQKVVPGRISQHLKQSKPRYSNLLRSSLATEKLTNR
jgi:hypothetical protein